jgi:hypothetical protein
LNGEQFKDSTQFLESLKKIVSEERFQEIKNLLEIREVMDS